METSTRTTLVVALALACACFATVPAQAALGDSRVDIDALVDAVCDVESGGNPYAVGQAGERGLMQIKSGTWSDVSRRVYGHAQPFSRAFEPKMNRTVGRAYLSELLARVKKVQPAGERVPMVAACYNRGPGYMEAAGYSLHGLSPDARDYVERVTNLYDLYSTERADSIISEFVPMATFTAPNSAGPDLAETLADVVATERDDAAATPSLTAYVRASLRAANAQSLLRQTMPLGLLCAFCVLYGNAAMARRFSGHMHAQRSMAARLLRREDA